MEPSTRVGRAQLFCGDVVHLLHDWDARPFDVTVTSPPYELGKEYEGVPDNLAWADYLAWTELWAGNLYDLTNPHGRLCVNVPLNRNFGGETIPFEADVMASFLAAGWEFNSHVVWDKGIINNATAYGSWMSASAPNVMMPVEMVLVFSKEGWIRGIKNRQTDITKAQFLEWRTTVWRIPGAKAKKIGHPAPFPDEIARRLLKLFSFREDLILDPFLGSGTTCAMAEELDRDSVGFDLVPRYLEELAAPRIALAADVRQGALTDSQGDRWVNLTIPTTDVLEVSAAS